MEKEVMTTYKYGVMSGRYELVAENKLTAYAVMVLHYQGNAHMVVIYTPEECGKDSWMDPTGQISERLDDVFGGKNSFDEYIKDNPEKIKACYDSIKIF